MRHQEVKVLIRGEHGSGGLALIDETVGPGFAGPPLHVHPDFDEAFYVLEGRLTFQLTERIWTASPGEVAFAPRGTAHTFANLSGEAARTLVICSPAGFERYFDRLAAELAGVEPPPDGPEPIPETIVVGGPISCHSTGGTP
jgi:mannose-6-phosphate isomerase-like protein (cupin superfamily)